MKTTRLRGLLAGALLVLPGVWGCTSSVLEVETSDVVGTWNWVRSTGGIAGMTRTPETVGYEAELRFLGGGTAEWRTDGELQWTTSWTLDTERAGEFAGKSVIRYGEPVFGWDEQAVSFARDGSLRLVDPCCDGFEHEYVREGS